jgi:hypothetical protein
MMLMAARLCISWTLSSHKANTERSISPKGPLRQRGSMPANSEADSSPNSPSTTKRVLAECAERLATSVSPAAPSTTAASEFGAKASHCGTHRTALGVTIA